MLKRSCRTKGAVHTQLMSSGRKSVGKRKPEADADTTPEKQQKVASPRKPPTETAPPGPPGPLPSGICQLHAVAKQFCEMGDLHACVDIATVILHDAMKNELASLDADGGAWVAENFGGMTAVSTEEYKTRMTSNQTYLCLVPFGYIGFVPRLLDNPCVVQQAAR